MAFFTFVSNATSNTGQLPIMNLKNFKVQHKFTNDEKT